MKILSIEGKELKACFQFDYKGWLVSFSTIYEKEVRIFFIKDRTVRTHIQFSNIPEAIKWIDENLKGVARFFDENSKGKVDEEVNDKLYYPLNHL